MVDTLLWIALLLQSFVILSLIRRLRSIENACEIAARSLGEPEHE